MHYSQVGREKIELTNDGASLIVSTRGYRTLQL
jgi:hypothetical protein